MSATTEKTSALEHVLHAVFESAEFQRVLGEIENGARVISISGLVAAPARALMLATLQRQTGKQFVLVLPAQRDLEGWERDLNFWYCALRRLSRCEDAVAVLPARLGARRPDLLQYSAPREFGAAGSCLWWRTKPL